ncbi:malonyl-CoA decarboxylase, mitochondrial isoform X1 [Canna indica]|uniref:Malonyl-CoA decarboxylase, mitochondrial isoform X1 n=1 Tax=Canna indica TaxID=4628 RepID=A0AAQ3K4I8_9LILI|nr:malonyl-CoA decarboxylase, mitochondrial isoform X1 [Canna indica]
MTTAMEKNRVLTKPMKNEKRWDSRNLSWPKIQGESGNATQIEQAGSPSPSLDPIPPSYSNPSRAPAPWRSPTPSPPPPPAPRRSLPFSPKLAVLSAHLHSPPLRRLLNSTLRLSPRLHSLVTPPLPPDFTLRRSSQTKATGWWRHSSSPSFWSASHKGTGSLDYSRHWFEQSREGTTSRDESKSFSKRKGREQVCLFEGIIKIFSSSLMCKILDKHNSKAFGMRYLKEKKRGKALDAVANFQLQNGSVQQCAVYARCTRRRRN